MSVDKLNQSSSPTRLTRQLDSLDHSLVSAVVSALEIHHQGFHEFDIFALELLSGFHGLPLYNFMLPLVRVLARFYRLITILYEQESGRALVVKERQNTLFNIII